MSDAGTPARGRLWPLLAAVAATLLLAASTARAALPAPVTVPALDLNRYAGTWYEVARLPQFFQRNCASDVTARYFRRPDGLVGVDNRCRKKNGKLLRAVGKARVRDPDKPGQLEVAFFLNFYADYWVVELGDAPDYGYSVVTDPRRKYLWILSRQPVMDARLYQRILARLRADGFDLRRLKPTLQTGHP